MINFSAITPHPPIIIPGIGQKSDLERATKTIKAMQKMEEEFTKNNPDTILLVSPHSPLKPDCFLVNTNPTLEGDLIDFGLQKNFVFENDLEVIEMMQKEASKKQIPLCFAENSLDHGALVPLYYLTKKIEPKLVHLAFSWLSPEFHLEYGKMLGRICSESSKKIAVIASGDMSHRLSLDAPAGYSPKGKIFDKMIREALTSQDISGVLNLDGELAEEAGECGLRSVIILLGILGKNFDFQLLSYEAPFGVGYLTARLIPKK